MQAAAAAGGRRGLRKQSKEDEASYPQAVPMSATDIQSLSLYSFFMPLLSRTNTHSSSSYVSPFLSETFPPPTPSFLHYFSDFLLQVKGKKRGERGITDERQERKR
jgi:hypothetical protein